VSAPRDLRQPVAFEVSLSRSESEQQDVVMGSPIADKAPTPATLNSSETTMASSLQRVQEFDTNMMELDTAVDELKRHLDHRNFIDQYIQEGEFVYELFAVLVHSGTSRAGHYYAYIKSFEDNNWYQFNDRDVSLTNEDSIERAYGRKYGEATAYLLKYRKVNLSPQISCPNEMVPPEFHEEAQK